MMSPMPEPKKKFTREQLLEHARSHGYLDAVCPKCGALSGEPCSTHDGWPHGKRMALQTAGRSSRSVTAIPTAVESSRRRH
jgi:hypothetical protein